jgi:hypothetical protein
MDSWRLKPRAPRRGGLGIAFDRVASARVGTESDDEQKGSTACVCRVEIVRIEAESVEGDSAGFFLLEETEVSVGVSMEVAGRGRGSVEIVRVEADSVEGDSAGFFLLEETEASVGVSMEVAGRGSIEV